MTAEEKEKAKKEAAEKLAAAQKEMAARYPTYAPYFVAEEVVAEGFVEPVTAGKPPKAGTVVAEGTIEPQPTPPAVPKRK